MQPEPGIRLLLIDDHAVARNGVRLTLGSGLRAQQPALAVLTLSIDGEEVFALRAIEHATATAPDVSTETDLAPVSRIP
ncbi:hypothetical protein [Caballeronia sp. INML2]|jgi:DNA-binding NarL/FixJ family response regulator|uniref:hypothetical protein n=1 Tax=Caballeronia sp. INML2 TaxID=2921748 RepID=UPI00202913CC|nr:hypothetical protein [Caballeronia sp. INML2]